MSQFIGPQGKGAMRQRRADRAGQARDRQAATVAIRVEAGESAGLDPREMLPKALRQGRPVEVEATGG